MNIVFAADNNYAAYLCVAAKSVETAHPDTAIRFYVLDTGISEANRAAVAANLHENSSIRFIPVSPDNFSTFPLNIKHISITTYARLKLGEYIADCDKILYLDIDLLVKGSLKPLWETDLGDNCVGACIDLFIEETNKGYKQKIGMEAQEYYFNAGVLLINLEKWRQNDIFKMSCEWVERYKDIMEYQDQDILNGLFKGQVCYLNSRFNFMPTNYDFMVGGTASENHDPLYRDRINAVMPVSICHYCGPEKQWLGHCRFLGAEQFGKLAASLKTVPEEWKSKFSAPTIKQKFKRWRRRLSAKFLHGIY